jgi:tRNA (cytidine/uridine-2'-O-)-methyltransferase
MSEAKLKRASLDYGDLTNVFQHDSFDVYLKTYPSRRVFMTSSKASNIYTKIKYVSGDSFVFGPESKGLPSKLFDSIEKDQQLYIPMMPSNRSINLANAVSIITYEAWRQNSFCGIIL